MVKLLKNKVVAAKLIILGKCKKKSQYKEKILLTVMNISSQCYFSCCCLAGLSETEEAGRQVIKQNY